MSSITINPKTLGEVTIIAKEAIQAANVTFKSQVVAVFDISGSMEGLYDSGIMDGIVTRILGLGLNLDDNGTVPVYAFNNSVYDLDDLKEKNLNGFTQKIHRMVGGGTSYAPFINRIVDDSKEGDPMLVLVFTDGDNDDHDEAEQAIVRASNRPIFFQWYGIYEKGYGGASFPFLERLNDLSKKRNDLAMDNCGFSKLALSISNTTSGDDEEKTLYADMLKEYKGFPETLAKAGVTWNSPMPGGTPRRKLFGLF